MTPSHRPASCQTHLDSSATFRRTPPTSSLDLHTMSNPGRLSKLDMKFLLNTPSSSSSSKNNPERSTCTICGHRFTQVGDMRKHVRTVHELRRPYKCDICGKAFGENGNLQKHRRSVHFREKPFHCTRCDSTFAFKDGLTRHLRLVHDNEHPFTCGFCGHRFKQKSQLRKHSESCPKVP